MFKWNNLAIVTVLLALMCMAFPSFAKPIHHHARHVNVHHKHRINKHRINRHQIKSKKPHHVPAPQTEIISSNANVIPPYATSFVSKMEQRLIQFVVNSISTLRYSVYRLGGTRFDPANGIYILDCSAYVDYILQAIYPDAYLSLVNSSESDKPTSQHYYDFFSALSEGPTDYWNKIKEVNELRAGDILVFRYKNAFNRIAGGHVMVVMDKPLRDENVYLIRIADSAPAGHSHDTRQPKTSGVGIGTLLLKVNQKTGQPSAYAWKIGSHWKSNVNFAMARPVNVR